MQVSKAQSAGSNAQKYRGHTVKRAPGTQKNGRGQTASADASYGEPGLHILMGDIKPLSMFEIGMRGVEMKNDKYLLQIIDTEEKQLQAILDLYQIVKAQPKYKKLREPSWKVTDSPVKILQWLLRKLGPLAKGNSWTVDTYKVGNKTRYRFVTSKYYHSQKVKCREEHMPIDFLPALKKRDEPLHDLIIDILALVSKVNKIPLWDEDGDFSAFLPDLQDRSFTRDIEAHDRQSISYTFGPAAQYLSLIKQRRKKITSADIWGSLHKYNASSQRKKSFQYWIRKGIELANTKQTVQPFSFLPNYLPGEHYSPFRLYKIVWSLHGNDAVARQANNKIKKDVDRTGYFLPVMFSIAHPGEKLKPIKYDEFPEDLYEFISYGINLVMWRHRDYFYKNQLKEKQTPAEKLLEDLEAMKIKNDKNGQLSRKQKAIPGAGNHRL